MSIMKLFSESSQADRKIVYASNSATVGYIAIAPFSPTVMNPYTVKAYYLGNDIKQLFFTQDNTKVVALTAYGIKIFNATTLALEYTDVTAYAISGNNMSMQLDFREDSRGNLYYTIAPSVTYNMVIKKLNLSTLAVTATSSVYVSKLDGFQSIHVSPDNNYVYFSFITESTTLSVRKLNITDLTDISEVVAGVTGTEATGGSVVYDKTTQKYFVAKPTGGIRLYGIYEYNSSFASPITRTTEIATQNAAQVILGANTKGRTDLVCFSLNGDALMVPTVATTAPIIHLRIGALAYGYFSTNIIFGDDFIAGKITVYYGNDLIENKYAVSDVTTPAIATLFGISNY